MSSSLKKVNISFTENYKWLENNNKIVLINRKNGCWMRISKECFDILNDAVESGLTYCDLENYFESEEDKEYINTLLNNLLKSEILVDTVSQEENACLESVDISLTDRCNLYCKHCAVSAGTAQETEKIDTCTILDTIKKIIECEPKHITLTGGEPTLRKDFSEIVNYIIANSTARISVMTNGTLITDEMAQLFAEHNISVNISLDGVDEETCSLIRGKGVFGKVIQTIEKLKQYGVKDIVMSMTVTKTTARREKEFEKLCDTLGIECMLRRLHIGGRAVENKEKLELNEKDVLAFEEFDENAPDIYWNTFQDNIRPFTCGAGKTSLGFSANGDIYPCSAFDYDFTKIGNIYKITSLKEFIKNNQIINCFGMKNFEEFTPYGGKICANCNVRYFCWTCPNMICDYLKVETLFQNRCTVRKKYLTKLIWEESY